MPENFRLDKGGLINRKKKISFKSKKSIWLLSTLNIDNSNNGFAAISFSDAINSSV